MEKSFSSDFNTRTCLSIPELQPQAEPQSQSLLQSRIEQDQPQPLVAPQHVHQSQALSEPKSVITVPEPATPKPFRGRLYLPPPIPVIHPLVAKQQLRPTQENVQLIEVNKNRFVFIFRIV